MNALSLFANIGVAEAYLEEVGINVLVANELEKRRADLYSKIYPNCKMICGDITDEKLRNNIIAESKKNKVKVVLATPPCQGMSSVGAQDEDDERNKLICEVISVVKELKPNYVFIENVPEFYQTQIKINDKSILIPKLIDDELSQFYEINKYVIDTADYGVPQFRERAIMLLTLKGRRKKWILPDKCDHRVTMHDAIGMIPEIDPYVKDVSDTERNRLFPLYEQRRLAALEISPWNIPPHHVKRQVVAMQHTASGCSAFDNDKYYPIKEDGKRVKGYHNTYSRQNWDTPAYTVTMDNRKISSQNNVHPGRFIGVDKDGYELYSDPRTLTLYELMIIMSIPEDWPVPLDTSEAFLRRIIGEGIPPLFVKQVFENI